MAKKQQSYIPSSSGDASLISGARNIGKANLTAVADVANPLITLGDAQQQRMQSVRDAQVAARQKISQLADARMRNYIDSAPALNDVPKVADDMQPELASFLTNGKESYFQYARTAANADPNSQEYMDAVQGMNLVTQSYKALDNDFSLLQAAKKKAIEDFENNNISNGTDALDKDFLSRLATGEVEMHIDPTTGRLRLGENGEITVDDLPKLTYKDYDAAKGVIDLNNELYTAGIPMDAGREQIVRMQIRNMVDKGGRNTIVSLATDDHIVPGGLGIDPSEYTDAELKELVVDQYVDLMKKSAQSGYQATIAEQNRQDSRAVERSVNLARRKKEAGIGGEVTGTVTTPSGDITISEQSLNRANQAIGFVNALFKGNVSSLSQITFNGKQIQNPAYVTQDLVDANNNDPDGRKDLVVGNIIFDIGDETIQIDPRNTDQMINLAKNYIEQYGMNDDTRAILDIINQIGFNAEDQTYGINNNLSSQEAGFMDSGLPAPSDVSQK